MQALKKSKMPPRQELSLEEIQTYVLNLEQIFYISNRRRHEFNYKKLDANSSSYDKNYEQKIRRKELNILCILDEVFIANEIHTHSLIDMLAELEDLIFSPALYRQIIFGVKDISVPEKIQELIYGITKKEQILRTKIGEEAYQASLTELQFLHPPKSRAQLSESLYDFIDFLNEKKKLANL